MEANTVASSDDAEEIVATSAVNLTSSDLELIKDGSSPQTVGMRWIGLAIPRGANITSAYIQFTSKEDQSSVDSVTFYGQAVDNAPTFTTATGNVSTRSRTAASVSWVPVPWFIGEAGANQRTPELRTLIQEVVNRPGWASGSALAVIVTGTGRRTAWAFDGNAAADPLLHVEYDTGTPTDDPPFARLTVTQTASLSVSADGSASTDTDATPIASYRFDFGDGSPAVTTTAPNATATHTYSDVATYTVTLIATDTGGNASAPVTKSITLNPPPDDPPVARLSVAQQASPPLTVKADASGSTDTDSTPIASYDFNFGDGTPVSTVAAPNATATHTYGSANTYTVSVVARDTGSHVSSPATQSITVTGGGGFPGSVEKRVAVSADDAEEAVSGGSVNLSSSDLELIQDGTTNQLVGMRWPGLTIPRGATITAAYLQFSAKESQNVTTNLAIQGQAADNPVAFTSATSNISSRPRTSASTSWAPVAWTSGESGSNQRTPDFKGVIQEIVNRSGWASGNAIVIIITGSGHRTAYSFDGSATGAPLLHVDYTSSSAPPDDPPVARLSVTQLASPPLTVTADGSASTDTDATPIASYRFDFGDGSTPVTVAAPNATATHTYASAGTRTLSLIATDTAGKASTAATQSFDVTSSGGGSSTVNVYVAYYDTHHTSHLQTKPSPWKGATDVTFVGTPDPHTTNDWDSSAIRIDNLGSTNLTGVTVKVSIGSKSFALWSSQSIGAGKTLIVAQTGFENFDGSDTNPAGCYGCNSKLCLTEVQSTKPVVHVTIGSKTTDYVDSGQILNTHGVDQAGCPYTGTRNDESHPWQQVFPGTAPAEARGLGATAIESSPRTLSFTRIGPNPTAGPLDFGFTVPSRGLVRLGVYDLQGRLVSSYFDGELESGEYRGEMQLGHMTTGMYFVRLWTPQGTINRGVVLMR